MVTADPTLNAYVHARLCALFKVTDFVRQAAVVDNINAFLKASSPEQMVELGRILMSLNEVSEREHTVIKGILWNGMVTKDNTPYVFGLLMVREALCSEFSAHRDLPPRPAYALYKGLVEPDGIIIPKDKKLTHEGTVAALRFAYEAIARWTPDCLPVKSSPPVTSTSDSNVARTIVYNSEILLDLIADNYDRVAELINLAVNRDTCDPDILAELLNSDGSVPLAQGWL